MPCGASVEGLQAVRHLGNAILQEVAAHYYLNHDPVSHLHQPNAFKNALVGFETLI